MFLKVFKDNSNQKHINKLLAARKAAVDTRKIQSVGIILNIDEFKDLEAFRAYLKELGIKQNKIKIINFNKEEKEVDFHWETYIGPKDFGWKGKINNVELQTFIDTEFDALISFFKDDVLELNSIVAQSKANFKIGLSNTDQRLYDLIIDVKPDQFGIFKDELKKYLTVLSKL